VKLHDMSCEFHLRALVVTALLAPLAAHSADGESPQDANLVCEDSSSMKVAQLSKQTTPTVKLPSGSATDVLWSADMETGTLSQWADSSLQTTPCGGEFSGAGGYTLPSREFSRSGSWSAKMTIPGESAKTGTAGTRLHRWCEPQRHRELYYSAWYFLPKLYTIKSGGWANWFQFKSKQPNGNNDPYFFLDVQNAPVTGDMRFLLTWWGGLTIDGPSPGQNGYRTWSASRKIPIRQWFHIEARYVCAGDFSGAIQVWQDGFEIFRLDGVRTRHPDGDCQWGINNYGTGISPSPVDIYIDDAVISTRRQTQ
jgi:hypothetical protein